MTMDHPPFSILSKPKSGDEPMMFPLSSPLFVEKLLLQFSNGMVLGSSCVEPGLTSLKLEVLDVYAIALDL